jgi:hypothetical protein
MTLYSATCAAAIGALLCLSLGVRAADRPEGCREDAKRLCQGVQPGGGRIMRCLKENESKLSPDCVEKMKAAKERVEKEWQACKPDQDKFCKGVEPGEGRVAKCLAQHRDALSDACRERISEAKSAFDENHPCHADAKKLCQGVTAGEGRVAACLKQHENEVSGACKDHLAHRGAARR